MRWWWLTVYAREVTGGQIWIKVCDGEIVNGGFDKIPNSNIPNW
jgi:hypothetical protein